MDEDIELMKFFEGIRRYQDEEEEVGKRAIEKLRVYKDKVGSNLQLMKGYRVGEFVHAVEGGLARSKGLLFWEWRRMNKTQRLARIFENRVQGNKKEALIAIKRAGSRVVMSNICDYVANVSLEREIHGFVHFIRIFKNRY